MRKLFLLILVFVCNVALGQGEVIKKGQKVLKRNAKILKAHYPWEYNEPSDWINIHYCPKDEILIVASDEGDRYVSFVCTTQAYYGQYTVEVYGGVSGDSLINTQTINHGIQYSYQLPLGIGKLCSLGYDTYKIRIYPTLSTTKLLLFEPRKHISSSTTNEGFLLLNANTSTLKTFKITDYPSTGITATRFKYANLWNCTGLTTLENAFFNCTAMVCATLGKTMDNLTNIALIFFNCTTQVWVKFPKYLDNVTTAYGMCYNNSNLEYLTMPISMNKLIQFGNKAYTSGAFALCVKLKQVQYPLSLNSLTNFIYANYNCSTATYYRMPSSMPNVANISYSFSDNLNITYLKLAKIMNKLTTANSFINNDSNLTTLIFPDSMLLCNDLTDNFGLSNLDTISTCVWGTGQVRFVFIIRDLKTFKQPTLRVRKFLLRGNSLATASALHTINIDWANSTYEGTSPQIDIRWNSLSATTIDAIFTALPTVTGKTINVAGNPGSATCTPSIASLKGWTVIIL